MAVKDLGAVTAFAYAKEHGYNGSEAEFGRLMGSLFSIPTTDGKYHLIATVVGGTETVSWEEVTTE